MPTSDRQQMHRAASAADTYHAPALTGDLTSSTVMLVAGNLQACVPSHKSLLRNSCTGRSANTSPHHSHPFSDLGKAATITIGPFPNQRYRAPLKQSRAKKKTKKIKSTKSPTKQQATIRDTATASLMSGVQGKTKCFCIPDQTQVQVSAPPSQGGKTSGLTSVCVKLRTYEKSTEQ